GCDAVMLGRAAFGDPWGFPRLRAFHVGGERLPQPSAADRLEAGIPHLRMMVDAVGGGAAPREMRKPRARDIQGLPPSAKVREAVNRTQTADQLAALLRDYLEDLEHRGAEAEGRATDSAAPVFAHASG